MQLNLIPTRVVTDHLGVQSLQVVASDSTLNYEIIVYLVVFMAP